MFVFQSWKNKSDFAAWNAPAVKNYEKVISNPLAWLIKNVIAPFFSSEKGMQCITHYLNRAGSEIVSENKSVKQLVRGLGNLGIGVNVKTIEQLFSMGEGSRIDLPSRKGTYYVKKEDGAWKLYTPVQPLRLALSKPEWEFILNQTKQDWFKSNLRNDLFKYDFQSLREEMAREKEMPMPLASSKQKLDDFKGALKIMGFEPNLTNDDVRKILTLKEGEKMYLALGEMSVDVKLEGGMLNVLSPPKGLRFYERMKREGIDLDKMEKEMKTGEKREFVDAEGRPYLAVKEKAMGGGSQTSLQVYYNRKWLPPGKDGWERMHMVPGGVNSTDMTANAFTDTWNALGFTTVARKKNKDGGYDYKIEEQFGFAGSRSADGVLYNRIVPNMFGKQIKKYFPGISVHPVEGREKVCEVIVNAGYMAKAGEEFPLIIDGARTGKDGKLHVKGEEPPPGSAF